MNISIFTFVIGLLFAFVLGMYIAYWILFKKIIKTIAGIFKGKVSFDDAITFFKDLIDALSTIHKKKGDEKWMKKK